MGLLVVAFWMLLHPYRGITHDGTLYGLLAVSHLHPGALDQDLFVRLGVQNSFTVFTPIYAGAARYLGFEHAAAVLTLLTHLAFFGSAWLLARQFGTARTACLGLGLLLVVPAYYGWGNVFAYTESFLTPRQPAEAFALAGLVAAVNRRQVLAGLLMLGALLLHPIIAAAAVSLWAVMTLGLSRPRLALTVVLTGTALLILLSILVPRGPLAHFDSHWLSILKDRLRYLFPTRWPPLNWGPAVVPLSALFVGALTTREERVRRICLATVLTVSFGVLIAIIESDWIHVIVAGQVQFWRWLWLSGVMAALLVPLIGLDCWRGGGLQRAAIILLAAAWVDTSGDFAVLTALGACCFAIAVRGAKNPVLIQIALFGSCAMLAFSCGNVAVGIFRSLVEEASRPESLYVRCMQDAHILANHGLLPALVLAGACWLIGSGRQGAWLLAVLGAAACAGAAPQTLDRWTQVAYSPQRLAAFATWRAAIPPDTAVLWPEDPPMDDWFLLERPSYWSLYQMAGMVFSRDDAMIGTWLEAAANPLLPAIRHGADAESGEDASSHSLKDICRLPGIAFVASWNNLGPTPFVPVAPDLSRPRDVLYLYKCEPIKKSTAPKGPRRIVSRPSLFRSYPLA